MEVHLDIEDYHLYVEHLPSGHERSIPPANFDFKNITVEAMVAIRLQEDDTNKEDFQDLFHFSSELEPSWYRFGVEVGLRNGKWMVGVNHGLSGSGYIESCVPGAVTGGQQTVTLTKSGYYVEIFVAGAVTGDRQLVKFTTSGSVLRLDINDAVMLWHLNINNDIDTDWLLPAVVVGQRKDFGDFEWLGAIHHLSIVAGKQAGRSPDNCFLLIVYAHLRSSLALCTVDGCDITDCTESNRSSLVVSCHPCPFGWPCRKLDCV